MQLSLIVADALDVEVDVQFVKHFTGLIGGAEAAIDDALHGGLQPALIELEENRFVNSKFVHVENQGLIGSRNLVVLDLGDIDRFSLLELEAAISHAVEQALENRCGSIATPVIGISDHVGLPIERAYRTVLQAIISTLLHTASTTEVTELPDITIFDLSHEKVAFFRRNTERILSDLPVDFERLSSTTYRIDLPLRKQELRSESSDEARVKSTKGQTGRGRRVGGRIEVESQVKLLYLAANPKDTEPLRLDEEIREIDTAFRHAEYRNRFDIRQHFAVRVIDLQSHLLRHEPVIVHFSGHGSVSSSIILEDISGNSQPVPPNALSRLFSVLKDNIRCVVLNACYSEDQARAIAEHIDCVVGMTSAVGDEAAIRFAAGFYQALGYGRDVKTAFELGCVQVGLEGLDDQDTPKLLALSKDPGSIRFV